MRRKKAFLLSSFMSGSSLQLVRFHGDSDNNLGLSSFFRLYQDISSHIFDLVCVEEKEGSLPITKKSVRGRQRSESFKNSVGRSRSPLCVRGA